MSTNRFSIAQEKALCAELIDVFKILDPFCCVAGGAPRNWELGQNANDFDLYINRSYQDEELDFDSLTEDRISAQLKAMIKHCPFFNKNGVSNITEKKFVGASNYDRLQHLLGVYEFNFLGYDVDLVFIDTGYNKHKYFRYCFDSTISMISFNGETVDKCCDHYDKLIEDETIIYQNCYSAWNKFEPVTKDFKQSKHFKKLVQQFPNWKHMTYKEGSKGKELVYV